MDDQEPRTVEEAQEAAREQEQNDMPVDSSRVTYLSADEVDKPAPVPLSEEEHGTEPFDGDVEVDESTADFDAEETNRKE